MNKTTPTGIAFVDCEKCGKTHPETREHCPVCGSASLFLHEFCGVDDG